MRKCGRLGMWAGGCGMFAVIWPLILLTSNYAVYTMCSEEFKIVAEHVFVDREN